MIMSLVGSGLLLIGLCMLYDLTGHLLMSDIRIEVAVIMADGTYAIPLVITVALMVVGLAIKSALFPFSCMAAGCLWVFHDIFGGHIVLPGIQRLYFSSD